MQYQRFKKGQSVKVVAGKKDYDTETYEIGGWQGRVIDLHEDEHGTFIEVQWDSLTLESMPDEYIEDSINEDLEYENCILDPKDLLSCEPRDTEADVHRAQAAIDSKYFDMEE